MLTFLGNLDASWYKQMREKESYWRSHIDRMQELGKSHREYCEENGLKIHTLRYWTRILCRTKAQVGATHSESVQFMELGITETRRQYRCDYEIEISGQTLRFGTGFDAME